MLHCGRVKQLLGALVSEELPASHRDRVEEHLSQCPRCAAVAKSYRAVIELGHRLPPLPLPGGMLQRLRQKVNERGRESCDPVEAAS